MPAIDRMALGLLADFAALVCGSAANFAFENVGFRDKGLGWAAVIVFQYCKINMKLPLSYRCNTSNESGDKTMLDRFQTTSRQISRNPHTVTFLCHGM
jgi:hypothetical protein